MAELKLADKPKRKVTTRFWEKSPHKGRHPTYLPENLLEACQDYFIHVEDTPLYENRVVSFKGETETIAVKKMRAMTIQGLCTFIGITSDTWHNYRSADKNKDYHAICEEVEAIMYDHSYTGAAADLLNANLITRALGLADKTNHVIEDKSELKELSDSELDQEIKRLESIKELNE